MVGQLFCELYFIKHLKQFLSKKLEFHLVFPEFLFQRLDSFCE